MQHLFDELQFFVCEWFHGWKGDRPRGVPVPGGGLFPLDVRSARSPYDLRTASRSLRVESSSSMERDAPFSFSG